MVKTKQQARDLQRWNYQIWRKLGYIPTEARKLRNRSPETTMQIVKERNRTNYRLGRKNKIVKPPPIPTSLKTKTELAKRRKFIKEKFPFMDKKKVAGFQNMAYENWINFKNRIDGFLNSVSDGEKATKNKMLREIEKKLGKTYTMKDLFNAIRGWYERNKGVKP